MKIAASINLATNEQKPIFKIYIIFKDYVWELSKYYREYK